MKDVGAAVLLSELVAARTNIEDHRVLRFGQVGDGEQILRLEIGNDQSVAIGEDVLGLGDHVAVGGNDRLFHDEVLAEELASGVVGLDRKPRAGNAFVSEYLLEQRERWRFLIGLAEIDDGDLLGGKWRGARPLDLGRGRLRGVSGAHQKDHQHEGQADEARDVHALPH